MSNLVTRAISGSIFVTLVVASILVHPLFFYCLFALLTALSVYELHHILDGSSRVNAWLASIGGVLLFSAVYLLSYGCGFERYGEPLLLFYLFYVICVLISELFRKNENPIRRWGIFLLSQNMVALPFALLNQILFISSPFEPRILLALFVIIWTNDTAAYCVGSLIGKHKMFPRVSPGKTWEGLIGGVVFALVAGWIFSMFVNLSCCGDYNLIQWLGFAFLVSVFGTLGDLMESLLKRTLGLKDSGNIIPGHGGMLDRFDSMLLCSPIITLYLLLIV